MISRVWLVAAVLLLVGACNGPQEPGELGPAAGKVTGVRGDEVYPTTAEITGWTVTVNPQMPDRGAAVRLTYRDP
jgi:hypothetical protein